MGNRLPRAIGVQSMVGRVVRSEHGVGTIAAASGETIDFDEFLYPDFKFGDWVRAEVCRIPANDTSFEGARSLVAESVFAALPPSGESAASPVYLPIKEDESPVDQVMRLFDALAS